MRKGRRIPKFATAAGSPDYSDTDGDYGFGLRLSVGLHVGLIAIYLLKSIVFPGKPILYIPSLRVDIVGLPDILKKDLQNVSAQKEINDALKKADQELKKVKALPPVKIEKKVEPAEKDEMVLHPKQAGETKAEREKRMKSALARIKALNKISAEADSERPTPKNAALIKGNKISKGTSLSGEAREAAEASYYDSLREKLQENWALPVWIARQNYSAQVQLFIDSRGRVATFKFVKTSGNAQFDDAVKRTIKESEPFEAPPDGLAGAVLSNGVLIGFPL